MSDMPPPAKGNLLSRKFYGVPVVYLVGVFVLVLAVIAWRLKPSPQPVSDPTPDSGGEIPTLAGRESLPEGTYTSPSLPVTPAPPVGGNTTIESNEDWLKAGVTFMQAKRGMSPGESQVALSKYLDGASLSYSEGQIRDAVIAEYGMPPVVPATGSTAPDVARSQGPLPRAHIVRNVNENSAAKLAPVYYYRSDTFAVDAIVKANGGRSAYNVGDTVQVPTLPVPMPPPAAPAIPRSTQSTGLPKPSPTNRVYIVKRGDTVKKLAKHFYGAESAWVVIARANKLKNPETLHAGERILIP